MRRTGIFTIALMLAAATAQAQYPGGGMGRRGGGREGGGGREQRDKPPAPPSRSDLEKQDPILVLISNRKALNLADSQVTKLAGADAVVMEKNRPLLDRVDSLEALMPKPGDDQSGSADQSPAMGMGAGGGPMQELGRVLHDVRQNYDQAAKDALTQLSNDQRPKASKLLEQQRPKESNWARRAGGG